MDGWPVDVQPTLDPTPGRSNPSLLFIINYKIFIIFIYNRFNKIKMEIDKKDWFDYM